MKQPNQTKKKKVKHWETVTALTEPYWEKPPKMECPHCHHDLSLKEAITILNGGALEKERRGSAYGGFPRRVRVRGPDGIVGFINAGECDPVVFEILE